MPISTRTWTHSFAGLSLCLCTFIICSRPFSSLSGDQYLRQSLKAVLTGTPVDQLNF
jgi:hypothetical protein